jgi:hypothetical protein
MRDEDDGLNLLARRRSRYFVYRIKYMILGVSVEGRCLGQGVNTEYAGVTVFLTGSSNRRRSISGRWALINALEIAIRCH